MTRLAVFLATAAYAGYFPIAPGTVGSAVGLLVYAFVWWTASPIVEAAVIAERIRQRVERTEFPHRHVTISVGVAGYTKEFEEPKDWITAADMALYEAKEQGRNIIRVYEDLGRSFREKIN